MLSIYIVYTWYIYSIFLGYAIYILGIYIAYTCIICVYTPPVGLVLRRRAGSHSTCSTSNHIRVAWTSHNFSFTGTRNRMSYQEYTRYIPGIFKLYTKCRPVDKLLNPVAGLAPRLSTVQRPFNRPLPYIYLCLSHIFQGYICYNIFNPLNLLNLL